MIFMLMSYRKNKKEKCAMFDSQLCLTQFPKCDLQPEVFQQYTHSFLCFRFNLKFFQFIAEATHFDQLSIFLFHFLICVIDMKGDVVGIGAESILFAESKGIESQKKEYRTCGIFSLLHMFFLVSTYIV